MCVCVLGIVYAGFGNQHSRLAESVVAHINHHTHHRLCFVAVRIARTAKRIIFIEINSFSPSYIFHRVSVSLSAWHSLCSKRTAYICGSGDSTFVFIDELFLSFSSELCFLCIARASTLFVLRFLSALSNLPRTA